jgi:hypothetical protein
MPAEMMANSDALLLFFNSVRCGLGTANSGKRPGLIGTDLGELRSWPNPIGLAAHLP